MKAGDIEYIVIHCSATQKGRHCDAAMIDQWHRERGWRCIGYHYVILPDGTVQPGRSTTEAGAHTKGYNTRSLGICLIGGLDENGEPADTFTDAQKASLEKVVTNCLSYAVSGAEVVGHRDLSPDLNGDGIIESWEWMKECPCFDVRAWWESVTQDSEEGEGDSGGDDDTTRLSAVED